MTAVEEEGRPDIVVFAPGFGCSSHCDTNPGSYVVLLLGAGIALGPAGLSDEIDVRLRESQRLEVLLCSQKSDAIVLDEMSEGEGNGKGSGTAEPVGCEPFPTCKDEVVGRRAESGFPVMFGGMFDDVHEEDTPGSDGPS